MVDGDNSIWAWLYWGLHSLSTGAIVGALMGWFPVFAAFVAGVWYCIQIYESVTFKGFINRIRAAKAAKLRAKLKALEDRMKP